MEVVIARNPDESSSLPYLVRLPLGRDGVALKVRETWPRTAKVYCHRADDWPDDLEVIERVPTLTSGKLRYLLADLATLPRAAVVVEDRWSSVFKVEHVRPALVAEGLAEAQVRCPRPSRPPPRSACGRLRPGIRPAFRDATGR